MADSSRHNPGSGVATSLDRATLRKLLRSIYGTPCHIVSYTTIRDGDDYAVAIVTLTEPMARVVVKLAGPRAALACPFDRTAAITRVVRDRTALPAPEVFAADVSYRDWPCRYIVMAHVDGATWAEEGPSLDATAWRDLYGQLGRAVARLHSIRFPAYGEIGADGPVLGDGSLVTALQERARRRVADPRHAELFVALLRDRAHLFDDAPEPALCHEDLNPTNILVRHDDGRWPLAAVLDFDSAWTGSPESDLARLELWQSGAYPGLMDEGFRAAYEETHIIAPGYEGRRPIYQLLWCLEYASASPQHMSDTVCVCAELGIPPIPFVREESDGAPTV